MVANASAVLDTREPHPAHFKVERGSSEIWHNCGDGKNLFETGVNKKGAIDLSWGD